MLGFDALGARALGELPRKAQAISMVAAGGAATAVGQAASFGVAESAATGGVTVQGAAASSGVTAVAAAGAAVVTGRAAGFAVDHAADRAMFALAGGSAADQVSEGAEGGAITARFIAAELVRTGDDDEFKLGGVGHLKLELEQARRLAAITRVPPPPIDRRTAPRFAAPPVVAPVMPPMAAPGPPPVPRKHHDIEAILLLAG